VNRPSDPSGHELDRLVGELAHEAAAVRAEPNFPHDQDVALTAELDRLAPGAHLDEVNAAARRLDELGTLAGAARLTRRLAQLATRLDLQPLRSELSEAELVTGAALRSIERRLARLEARVDRLDALPEAPGALGGGAGREGDDETDWLTGLGDELTSSGRVLYAGPHPLRSVARLRAERLDAYGVSDAADVPQDEVDVAHESLYSHLAGLADSAIAAAILVGLPVHLNPSAFRRLVKELARVATTVVVVSEAPWRWRQRVGATVADLALERPLDAETWLAAFVPLGLRGRPDYDRTASTYRLLVRRQERAEQRSSEEVT